MTKRLLVRSVLIAAAIGVSSCASTASTRWDRIPRVPSAPASGSIFVMEPVVEGAASPGNVGRDFRAVRQEVRSRILAIVHQRLTTVDVIVPSQHLRIPALATYPGALGTESVTTDEVDAANVAFQQGATHLIAPTILEWTEMRTDDPIGALVASHNRIAIDLRLMQLQPPALLAHVVFRNRARLTLNQPAVRLLDRTFRNVVLQLVSGLK